MGICLALASCSDGATSNGALNAAAGDGSNQAGQTNATGTQTGAAGTATAAQAGREAGGGNMSSAGTATSTELGAGAAGAAGGGGEDAAGGQDVASGGVSGEPNTGGLQGGGAAGSPTEPEGSVIFVRAGATEPGDGKSWATAFPRLETALDAAVAGQKIWVAQGSYRPGPPGSDHSPSYYLKTGVAVYGGFDGVSDARMSDRDPETRVTILDGDMNANDGSEPTGYYDDAYVIVTAADVGPSDVLDGFTVQNAGPGNDYSTVQISNDPPTLRNLRLRRSHTVFGGALGFGGTARTSADYENLVFEDNESWGVAIFAAVDFSCRGCRFLDNGQAVTVGGDFFGKVVAKFIDTDFEDSGFSDWNTEVNIRGPADVTLQRCRLALSAEMSLAALDGGALHIIDSVATGFTSSSVYDMPIVQLSANVANDRPVVATQLDLISSTFFNNGRAGDEFLMVWGGGGSISVRVYDSVIDNPGKQLVFYDDTGFSITTNYSYFPGQTGTGNITQPPLLDAAGRPTVGSPLIDAGTTAVPDGLLLDAQDLDRDGDVSELLPRDFDNGARVVDYPPLQGPKIDVGAFEAVP